MSFAARLLLPCALALLTAAPGFAQAPVALATPGPCVEGALPFGARSLMCVPTDGWNGSLVVFAHGYVPPQEPLQFAHLQLADGTGLPTIVQQLGFAFATTTYRQNGLAVLEGVNDIRHLVDAFKVRQGLPPDRVFLIGASEGGLVAVLAAEADPFLFSAAYALCAPIGHFGLQVNYVGDFRVLYDALFPAAAIPGPATSIPLAVQDAWRSGALRQRVADVLNANPTRARELLRVARAPYDPGAPETIVQTALGLLDANILGVNDARAKLGGNPFDNRLRWYSGSSNDLLLNLRVKRFDADPPALAGLRTYTPVGDLRLPLVTLHTTGDELIPYAHELVYAARVDPSDRGRLFPLPVPFRYGHCAFQTSEVLTGFALMLGASVSPAVNTPVATLQPSERGATTGFQ